MIRTRHTSILIAVLVLMATVASVATPVAAQSDDGDGSLLDGLLTESDDENEGLLDSVFETVANARAYAAGLIQNVAYYNPLREPTRTPAECAADIGAEISTHSAAYLRYVNDRTTADTSRNVIQIMCTGEDAESESVYLVADVNATSGEYQGLTAVSDTEREVDHTVYLSGLATEELPDDLAAFRKQYVEPNQTPNGTYVRLMAGKYLGSVHGTFEFLPDRSDSK
jgi:hypothetical protein